MRPILLKGHEKPITHLTYNREGDLLFTCSRAKEDFPTVWWSDNGERIGTYHGHNGAVFYLDVTRDSKYLLTASADATVKLWMVETGKELFTFHYDVGVRCCAWATGDRMFLSVTENVMGHPAAIHIHRLADDLSSQQEKPLRTITGQGGSTKPRQSDQEDGRILQALWGPLNTTIIACHGDGTIRVYDAETGQQVAFSSDHKRTVNRIQFDKHQITFISASRDGTAKLFDTKTLKCLKTYETGRPVNAASISPIMNHVIVAGGEQASTVTLTRLDTTQFRVRFFHKIFEEELGSIMGHFGPVHALSFSPDGRSFASGAEDGYVRLHHFDESYFRYSDELEKPRPPLKFPQKKSSEQ